MTNGCRIHLNNYKFFGNEGVLHHPSSNEPLILRTNSKKNFIKAISCNVGPTRFSEMFRPMFYFKDTDFILNLNDKGDYDIGVLDIKLFKLGKPYTKTDLAVDLGISALFKTLSFSSTSYLYAWVDQKKNPNENVDFKIQYKNGHLIQKIRR
jgi:hypothetical protein